MAVSRPEQQARLNSMLSHSSKFRPPVPMSLCVTSPQQDTPRTYKLTRLGNGAQEIRASVWRALLARHLSLYFHCRRLTMITYLHQQES